MNCWQIKVASKATDARSEEVVGGDFKLGSNRESRSTEQVDDEGGDGGGE